MAGKPVETKVSFPFDGAFKQGAAEAAQSAEQLRVRIDSLTVSMKEHQQALRSIKGETQAAKDARAGLKARIEAEKSALSASNLALVKQGTTYGQVTSQAKKLEEAKKKAHDKMVGETKALTSSLDPLTSKLGVLGDMLKGAGSAESLAAVGMAGLAAAVAAVTVALVAGTFALGKWIAGVANARRTMGLMREAALGNAKDADALGTQIDALAAKVPTAKAALNDLGVSLAKSGLGGRTLVDTLNAVAQASAALGDDAGNKVREFVERGRLTQRFSLNPMELQGTGLKFDDVAKALSKNLNVGINDARTALYQGRVKLADGAEALRTAVEGKFSKLNLRRMLDLNVMAQKFWETVDGLTSDVDVEPLLSGFGELTKLFSQSEYTGVALKEMVTLFGNTFGKTIAAVAPYAGQFFKGMVLASLDLAIAFFKVRNALRDTFGGSDTLSKIDWMKTALMAGKLAVTAFAVGLVMLGAVVAVAFAPFVYAGKLITNLVLGVQTEGAKLVDWFRKADFKSLGTAVVDGLVDGVKGGVVKVTDAVKGLGRSAKDALKEALGIRSPSKVFADLGRSTAEGFSEGLDDGSGGASSSASNMVRIPQLPAGAGSRGPLTLAPVIHIHVEGGGGGDPQAVAAAVASPEVLSPFRKALAEVAMSLGLPTEPDPA